MLRAKRSRLWLTTLVVALLLVPIVAWAVDVTVTAANVVSGTGATFADGTAGATITAGQVVYRDASDANAFKLADCDAAVGLANAVGIALHGASDGQPLKVQTAGNINVGGTLTVGGIYVLSGTAGGIAPVADLAQNDHVTVLGVATTASNLVLKINVSGVQVP